MIGFSFLQQYTVLPLLRRAVQEPCPLYKYRQVVKKYKHILQLFSLERGEYCRDHLVQGRKLCVYIPSPNSHISKQEGGVGKYLFKKQNCYTKYTMNLCVPWTAPVKIRIYPPHNFAISKGVIGNKNQNPDSSVSGHT